MTQYQIKKEREKAIEAARLDNQKNGKKGNVTVAKKPHYRSKGPKTHPRREGYLNIDVTSGTMSRFKALSPMLLGPTNTIPSAQNIENLWQFSKVFEGDLDEEGNLTKDYLDRRNAGYADTKAHRRSKRVGSFQFHYWKGKRIKRLKARKEIYVRNYMNLAKKSQVYKELEIMVNNGTNIQIIGYDGIDYDASNDKNGSLMKKMYINPDIKFGHELVLAAMLLGIKL